MHHVLVFCREPEGTVRRPPFTPVVPKLPASGSNGGEKGPGTLIATTAPGTNGMTFPEGTGLLIKAGSVLTFQIHYTAKGKPTEDTSSVGLIFPKQPPQQEMRTGAFMNPMFTLPPGDPDKDVDSAIQITQFTRSSRTLRHECSETLSKGGGANRANTTRYLPEVYRSTKTCFPNTWRVQKGGKLVLKFTIPRRLSLGKPF